MKISMLALGVLGAYLFGPALCGANEGLPPLDDPVMEASGGAGERFEHDRSSRVSVLGYHRFGKRATDKLMTSEAELDQQIAALRDAGFEIVSMADFLAWRRGEGNLPAKSAVITIDDGYSSIYEIAHPVFQKHEVPYTVFVYTNYIDNGGAAITWEMLRQLRDAGVTIGSHGMSHKRLAGEEARGEHNSAVRTAPHPKDREELVARAALALTPFIGVGQQLGDLAEWSKIGMARDEYERWVWEELYGSRRVLEKELEVPVETISYPYGVYSDRVAELAALAGYQAMFTVNGDEVTALTPDDELHRYIVYSDDPSNFNKARRFREVAAEPGTDPDLPVNVTVRPGKNTTAISRAPEIFVELSGVSELDPTTLSMSVSGFGPVPAEWDAAGQVLRFQPEADLRNRTHTVTVSARQQGRPWAIRWSFEVPIVEPLARDSSPAGGGPASLILQATPAADG